jgi:hypothetical protein
MTRRQRWLLPTLAFLTLAQLAALLARPSSTKPVPGEDPSTVLGSHRFPVQALTFSPDGATLAVAVQTGPFAFPGVRT